VKHSENDVSIFIVFGGRKMGELKIVSPSEKYQSQYIHFIDECKADIQKCAMSYYMPFSDNNSFSEDLQHLINNGKGLNLPEGWVAASTYWLMDDKYIHILGTITIRHALVGYLFFRGGHISYYINLYKRRNGYATKMLSLALKECTKYNLDKVMITCAKDNIGSSKTIENNGGILHSEDNENGEKFKRYWINI
jgi:predicted acetyltransferase